MLRAFVNKILALTIGLFFLLQFTKAAQIIIPMDVGQKNHLKAYGIAYWCLTQNTEVYWLLNYRGGSFLIQSSPELLRKCAVRGVSTEHISDAAKQTLLDDISNPEVNQDAVKLEKAPKIAVYTPGGKQPWDDAVTLVLTYAEIPYDEIYDEKVYQGVLKNYDWLHLHHEDFTGQFGKFGASFSGTSWYQAEVKEGEEMAAKHGFGSVRELKLAIAKKIRDFTIGGGFLFAMCSATDSYDIALAAENTDICSEMFDGTPADPNCQKLLDYNACFAFTNFTLEMNPTVYEFSDIDVDAYSRNVEESNDLFTLFDYSAKWDIVPTILCQNHTKTIKGFMGQTTAFKTQFIKSDVLIMGENAALGEAKYIHGEMGKGTWTFYGGHDPEDYKHHVGEPPTDLNLHPNSPGYRLILNNILFPSAKKSKLKT